MNSGIMFTDCVWEDDGIVFSSLRHNAICKMGEDGNVQVLDSFQGEDCVRPFSGIYQLSEDEYLFSPDASKDRMPVIWNRKTKDVRKIVIDSTVRDKIVFSGDRVYRYGDYIYVIQIYPCIIRIEIGSLRTTVIKFPDETNDNTIIWNVERVGDIVFIPMISGQKLYMFNLETEHFESVFLKECIEGVFTIASHGRSLFLTGNTNGIVEFNIDAGSIKRRDDFLKELSLYMPFPKGREGYYFGSSVVMNDDLFLFPGFADMILKYHIPTSDMKFVCVDNEAETQKSLKRPGRISTAKYSHVKRKDDELLFCSFMNECVYIYNTISGDLNTINPRWSDKDEQKKALNTFDVFDESMIQDGLYGFIDLLI